MNMTTTATTTERAFDLLAGVCEARGLNVTYKERGGDYDNAVGIITPSGEITIQEDCTTEEKLNALLHLLSQREICGAGKGYTSTKGSKTNPFARFAKKLILELLDESEGF